MSNDPKKTALSADLKNKLNEMQNTILEAVKKEVSIPVEAVKPKEKNWRDPLKVIGTFVLLFCWGWENYLIKPRESAKLQQQYARTMVSFQNSLVAQKFNAVLLSDYIVSTNDSSKYATIMSLRSDYEYVTAKNQMLYINNDIIGQFLPNYFPKDSPQANYDDFKYVDSTALAAFNSKDRLMLHMINDELDTLLKGMSGPLKAYDKEYFDINKYIKTNRNGWAIGYITGSIFILLSLWPKKSILDKWANALEKKLNLKPVKT
jgi:hypothetical protein